MVGILADPAAALVTDFTLSPPDPVMGETVLYRAVDDGLGPSVASYTWQYKYTSGACSPGWITAGSHDSSVMFSETRPGTWDVRLTVTYNPPPMPPHADTVITKSVTIAPATSFTIVEGLDTPTSRFNSITVKFRVNAASRPCGPGVSQTLAQEKITNKHLLSPPFYPEYPPDDTDWTPSAPDPVFRFPPGSNTIWDVKSNGDVVNMEWANIPLGSTYYTITQHLRIKYTDPCSDLQTIDLGSVILRRVKSDDSNWKIQQGP